MQKKLERRRRRREEQSISEDSEKEQLPPGDSVDDKSPMVESPVSPSQAKQPVPSAQPMQNDQGDQHDGRGLGSPVKCNFIFYFTLLQWEY